MTQHASIEDLLAVRDGDGTQWARTHAESCPACAAELYRLEQTRSRLKALPALTPPRDRWQLVMARAKRERRTRWIHSTVGLTAAAVLAAVTFVAVRPKPQTAVEQVGLDRAMLQSRAMEATLKALAPDRRPLNGDAATVAADLEANLTKVDSQLNDPLAWRIQPDRVENLWRERTGILSALVDVHQANATYASF